MIAVTGSFIFGIVGTLNLHCASYCECQIFNVGVGQISAHQSKYLMNETLVIQIVTLY